MKRILANARSPSATSILGRLTAAPDCEVIRFEIEGREVFFGYYDKRQLSNDGTRLLAASVDSRAAGMHEPSAPMEVGWFDVQSRHFQRLATTSTYNWQQGCMLRWLPGSKDRYVTFNRRSNGRSISVVVDADTGALVSESSHPVYDIAPSGELMATCDFLRLHHCRLGYGYWQPTDGSKQEAPQNSGSVLVRLFHATRDEEIRQISVGEILYALETDVVLQHVYVNHLSFSPLSRKLIFFFFWRDADSPKMAVMLYDRSTDVLQVLTKNYMSHFCWEDDNSIVAWGADGTGNMAYYRYTMPDMKQTLYWADGAISDGHCSILPDGTMLTDTYPDERGIQYLFRRTVQGTIQPLAQIYSPAKFIFDLRCDLHPRMTPVDNCFSFDSGQGGRRATYLIRPC